MTYSPEKPTKYPNGIGLGNDVCLSSGSGAPSATTLDGVAGPGSMYFDYTNKVTYINTGTKAAPSWELMGGSGAGAMRVYNGTGSPITEGQLLYLSSVDATTSLPKVVLADADVAGRPAEWVARGTIADAAAGVVYKTHRLTGQNDNVGTVGDERYLSATAGGYTATDPTTSVANAIRQVIGFLEVKSATVGVVNIDLARLEQIGINELGVTAAGTAQANRPAVLGASKELDELAITTQTRLAYNASGSTIVKGALVRFIGTHTNGQPKIVLADANVANGRAQAAAQADILTAASGTVITHGLSPATLDTSASSAAEAPAYLSETAGDVGYSDETETDEISQIVGYVVVDHATTGQLYYDFTKVQEFTVAQLNGVTATAEEINEVDDITSVAQTTIAVAAEAGGNSITVTVTLKDAAGAAVNEARLVTMWLSSSATTGAIAAATSGGASFSTGLATKVVTTGVMWEATSSTGGVFALDIVEAGALGPIYLWVRMPNGQSKVSGAITFAG